MVFIGYSFNTYQHASYFTCPFYEVYTVGFLPIHVFVICGKQTIISLRDITLFYVRKGQCRMKRPLCTQKMFMHVE